MKCCLNSNLPKDYLEEWADEIKFQYKDRKSIPDFVDYKATIILELKLIDSIDWNEIRNYNILAKGNFILCVPHPDFGRQANQHNIKWYYGFPITSYYELKGILNLNPSYLKIGAPLFFDFELVKSITKDIPIRAVPNVAYNDGLPRENGLNGTWIRPEDLDLYEKFIDTIEFEDCDRDKEQTLHKVYFLDREWSVLLKLLITNLNYDGVGRMVQSQVTRSRLGCRQRCAEGFHCKICQRAFDLANPDRVETFAEDRGLLKTT